jgi:hypothetical protein
MELKKHRIRYKDGRVVEVDAEKMDVSGAFVRVLGEGGVVLHRYDADSVESFGFAEIPEARKPAPKMGTV